MNKLNKVLLLTAISISIVAESNERQEGKQLVPTNAVCSVEIYKRTPEGSTMLYKLSSTYYGSNYALCANTTMVAQLLGYETKVVVFEHDIVTPNKDIET